LEHRAVLLVHFTEERAHVFHGAALDYVHVRAELRERAGELRRDHDNADAAGDGRRQCVNLVRAAREVVPAGRTQIEDRGYDRLAGALAELLELAVHQVGRGDAAAGRVDAQHDRADVAVRRCLVELLRKQRHGIFAASVEQIGRPRVLQHAVDVDERELLGGPEALAQHDLFSQGLPRRDRRDQERGRAAAAQHDEQ